ncbi:MAG: hypothetical protein ACRD0F_02030, partial [Acidimicrobiales bacterium]
MNVRTIRSPRRVLAALVLVALLTVAGGRAEAGTNVTAPAPPQTYWQQRFEQRLGILASDLTPGLRTLRIAQFYASMAKGHPDMMLWAGVASQVSGGLGVLLTARTAGAFPGDPTAPVVDVAAMGPGDRALR